MNSQAPGQSVPKSVPIFCVERGRFPYLVLAFAYSSLRQAPTVSRE